MSHHPISTRSGKRLKKVLEAKCIYNRIHILIFVIQVLNHYEYRDSDNRLHSERIENTFIDINIGGFQMRSIYPHFFHELSFIKSIMHLFLYGKMGSMTNPNPESISNMADPYHSFKDRLCWGDPLRGYLYFRLVRKDISGKDKKEAFLNITTKFHPRVYENSNVEEGSFDYDYREVEQLETCLGKALNLFDHRIIHPLNKKEFLEKWDMTKWEDLVFLCEPV